MVILEMTNVLISNPNLFKERLLPESIVERMVKGF